MRAAPYEEGPRCPCTASGHSSHTKTRTLRGVRLTSLRRKEITWQFQKRHPKQKHRRYVPTAEWKWSLSVSNQFCLVGNSRISLSHARSAVLRKSSGSSAFVIRNLPEEMVLDRRPVPHQPASPNRGACSAHHQDHLRMVRFAAVHESGVGTTRKRLAARIDSANWGEANCNAAAR